MPDISKLTMSNGVVYNIKDSQARKEIEDIKKNGSAGSGGSGGGAVESVNGQTGAVVLEAEDVGALPSSTSIPTKVSDLTNDSGFQTAPFEIEVTQSGSTYSTTASAADILAHIDNCVLVEDGAVLQQAMHQVFGSYAVILFANNTSVNGYIANASFVVTIDGSNVSVDYYSADARPELPSVTASDNGKVLGVVNGEWAVKSDEGGESVTVDDALSTTSENPVQNKVVKAALDGLTASDVGIEFMTAEDADDLWADADADIPDTEASGKVSRITEKLVLKESNNLSKSDSDWIVGYIVSNTNGNLVASSALSTSDYIPVNEGDVIRLYDLSGGTFGNREMRAIATYDANKTAVSNPDSTGWRQYSYTVVDGIKFVRVSALNASQYMITKNYAPTVFEPWFEPYYVATREFVEDSLSDLTADQLKNGLAFALPQTIFRQTVGLSQTWYKKSMITPPSEFVYVRGGETGTTDFADKVTFQNASAKNSANGYLWYAYDPYFNLLKKYDAGTGYGASAKVIAENLQDCTVLVIGDSTVDAGNMTGSMLSYFTSKGKTLTLLGTLSENGNPLNRNEGRAGWNTADYMTNSTNSGYTNPFYNSSTGTFDFSYYMSQQGYSGVDFVVIQLGINDLYPSAPKNTTEPDYAAIWANMAAMISSIKAYNNSTKVIINLPTTPNSDPTKHGICEFLYRHWVVRYNEYALAKIKDYGTASVRASYCHLILDPATDIRDNVHPTAAGYEKMALELINQINVWQDGA